jgi:type IV secretory pathway protease TraF
MKYADALFKLDHNGAELRPQYENRPIVGPNFRLHLLLGAFVGVVYLLTHFTLNWSASLPTGLYHITHDSIRHGSLVLLKNPLKEIVAVPGDTVQWDTQGVSVNGRLLKNSAVPSDSPYPPYPYTTLKLAADQYLAMGTNPLSYDGRYLGPTPASLIASTVQPFWTQK